MPKLRKLRKPSYLSKSRNAAAAILILGSSTLVREKSSSTILDKFVPECFYRGSIRAQALDKSIRAQAFWQEIANNKTQKTNNNQIQNINDQKIACRWVGL